MVSALSFTTEPQFGEPPKVQVRQQFEELGFIPGSRMLDEGPAELDGERAYHGIFGEYSAGFPLAHLLVFGLWAIEAIRSRWSPVQGTSTSSYPPPG